MGVCIACGHSQGRRIRPALADEHQFRGCDGCTVGRCSQAAGGSDPAEALHVGWEPATREGCPAAGEWSVGTDRKGGSGAIWQAVPALLCPGCGERTGGHGAAGGGRVAAERVGSKECPGQAAGFGLVRT